MIQSEEWAIKKCQKGELKEFGLLYDAYIKKIYDFIYYKTLHKETAEDLASLTFTSAFGRIAQFDQSKGTFQAWIYEIARNNVRDHYRRIKETENLEDVYDLASKEDLEINANNALILENVKRFLNKLDAEQREIFIMRIWDDLPFKDVAEIRGITLSKCKMSFYRTALKLKEEMALIVLIFLILLI